MPKGSSDYVFKAKKLTDAKIAATLFVEPFRYSQLQFYTRIQRHRLHKRLQKLIQQDIVFKHNFSVKRNARNNETIEYNSAYYLLNYTNVEAQNLVAYWFESADKSISIDERIERSSSATMIRQRERMLHKFVRLDKNKLPEEKRAREFNLFLKNVRILDLLYVCECKMLPILPVLYSTNEYQMNLVKTITNILESYGYYDTLIKLCADHYTPFLLPYSVVYPCVMKIKTGEEDYERWSKQNGLDDI